MLKGRIYNEYERYEARFGGPQGRYYACEVLEVLELEEGGHGLCRVEFAGREGKPLIEEVRIRDLRSNKKLPQPTELQNELARSVGGAILERYEKGLSSSP